MKMLVVFFAVLAVATSYPVVKTWTLTDLSDAIENSKGDPAMMPYLEDALNEIMLALFTGKNEKFVHAVVPSPSGAATWTVAELTKTIADPSTKPEYRPSLIQAYNFIIHKNETGNIQESVEVAIPALDISTWSLSDLNEALKSPSTKSDLIPYLEKARTQLKNALEKGEEWEKVYIVTPVGLIPPKANYEFLTKASKNFTKKTRKGL